MKHLLLNTSLALGIVASLSAACIDLGEEVLAGEVIGVLRVVVFICGVGIFAIGIGAVIYRFGLHGFNNEE